MLLYEKRWWKKLFKPKKYERKEDTLKDIEAISEFLKDVNDDAKFLLHKLTKLRELEKERSVARKGIMQVNLEAQAELLDKILERYEFFQNDVDINGIRVKRISQQLLKHAKHEGMKELVGEKKKDMKWKFDW